jgi:hypothetical protein
MTISIQCPGCQRTLRVPDHYAGRKAKCPGCSAPITIPAAGDDANPFGFTAAGGPLVGSVGGRAVDAPPEEDERVSADLDRMRKMSGWQGVAGGLNNIWLGTGLQVLGLTTVVLVASALLGMSSGVAYVASGPDSAVPPTGSTISALLVPTCMVVFVLGGTILRLVGFVRCLATPRTSGAWLLALLALLSEVALLLGGGVATTGSLLTPLLGVLGYTGLGIGSIAGLVFLLLYLRQIGVALAAKPITARVRHFVLWLLVGGPVGLLLLGISLGMMMLAARGGPNSSLGIVGIPGCGCFFVTLLALPLTLLTKYLGTISLVADELKKRTSRFWV